ncbi:MAG TPA: hypothetical protein VGH76_19285 [Actinomycetospora sp.]|jgi:hypothetical protein|uniref:hypothetical protein n=1 Tax=Actinomycetospora sp. TaxID=1872135 RepID=UPI002F4023AD
MITMTVSGDRLGYLDETLDSWSRVRGLRDRSFGFVVRPRQSPPVPAGRLVRGRPCAPRRRRLGFDFGIERIAEATGLRFVAPLASRSDNIGREGGVHALPEDFEAGAPRPSSRTAPLSPDEPGGARRDPWSCPLPSGDDEHAGGPVDRSDDGPQ